MELKIFVVPLILLLWYDFISCQGPISKQWIMKKPPKVKRRSLTDAEVEAADHIYQGTLKMEKDCDRELFQTALTDAGTRHLKIIRDHPYGPSYSVMRITDLIDLDLFRERMHFLAKSGKKLPEVIHEFNRVPKAGRGETSAAGASGAGRRSVSEARPSSVHKAESSGSGKNARVKFTKALKNLGRVISSSKKGKEKDMGDYQRLSQSSSDDS